MTKLKFLTLGLLCSLLLVTSCQKDDPVVINEAQVLVEYLESASSPLQKDYVNTDMPSIIGASDLNSLNLLGQAYIIDIRAAADYNTGHILNAHNVAVADLFSHLESADLTGIEKIVIVCYSGQTAGWATSLLRIKGYDNVFSLKWGMCSWNSDFASGWTNAVANGNAYAAMFEQTANAKGAAGELPELNTGFETGQEILDARLEAVLTEGYNPAKISAATLFANTDDYYIVNYWPETQYLDPGHIPGAVQYTPKTSIKLDADLTTLPTDKPIVVYCYTGQTSSFLAAYLRLLGYDARSLLYGANGMIYDMMVTKQMTVFSESQVMGYDYVD